MPTSATGTERRADPRRPRRPKAGAGFTLVELVVVLAIAALLAGASAFAYPRFQETMQYRAAVRGIVGGLHHARTEAMRAGGQAQFFVDLNARSYGVDERVQGRLPDSLDVRFVVARREIGADGRGAIRFYADGASTGGSIDLIRPSAVGVRVRVDWLLGRITQESLP